MVRCVEPVPSDVFTAKMNLFVGFPPAEVTWSQSCRAVKRLASMAKVKSAKQGAENKDGKLMQIRKKVLAEFMKSTVVEQVNTLSPPVLQASAA